MRLLPLDLPMDGFHFSREHLAGMPNPVEATHRRGAAFTFDGLGFLALIKDLVAEPARYCTVRRLSTAV